MNSLVDLARILVNQPVARRDVSLFDVAIEFGGQGVHRFRHAVGRRPCQIFGTLSKAGG